MDPLLLILLALAGVVAGCVNVLAGGGSLLTLPIMVFMGLPGSVANGSNRVAILLQNITAVVTFYRKGIGNITFTLKLVACALPGTIAGAMVGAKLSGVLFNRVLAVLMILLMFAFSKKKKNHEGQRSHQHRKLGFFLMVLAGFYIGFIQAGAGFIFIFILHRVMGLNLVEVSAHKVFCVAILSIAALSVYAIQSQVNWSVGLVLAAGSALGAWIGTHLAVGKGDRFIQKVFNLALICMAMKLLYNSFQ